MCENLCQSQIFFITLGTKTNRRLFHTAQWYTTKILTARITNGFHPTKATPPMSSCHSYQDKFIHSNHINKL
ncbi:hypothetical protein HMPREF3226_02389 [Prevotella corporis]|uniref:Uncharacterized protein n=1 Tax=Prevotella corporis TaxID=28128 RepID=A0A133PVT0_9BACT|nr:hypothetical protein HMPREF3226_02389 [Prevotella corporis]